MRLTSWGKYPWVDTTLESPRTETAAIGLLDGASSLIGRGLGRSYGDSALNRSVVVSCLKLDAMESFDETTGILVAESGVTLEEIIDAFLPRGWFLPVTPGTKFVTLGGAVASDVHGKNHHEAGSFAGHVPWFDLWTPAQGIVRCSPTENEELFHATTGGHGLTGLITRVALRMVRVPSAFISQKTVKAASLAHIMEAFEEYASLPFSVAWIDCLQKGADLGRSIFMGGSFASPQDLPFEWQAEPFVPNSPRALKIPLDFPSFALNTLSVKAFNAQYYAKAPKGVSGSAVSYNTFFYPLDSIREWNRIYGKRGFTQYQFVIPKQAGPEGLHKILHAIAESGQGSFLAVLKLFGKQPKYAANISFPVEGYTLALDFPITKKLFPLLNSLDSLVLEYGGRHYLTKDSRLSGSVVKQSYGSALERFRDLKNRIDPEGVFSSLQSDRLGLFQKKS